ncbi:unnamed protein product [Penicillium pancosmium]
MAKPKETKPARITVACNACRSRKQKCSGDKPVCGQCLENNRPCDWPEQLRRGPAKGHVEALEHRLQVTEGVLFRLLSQVSDAQLSNAFPREGAISQDGTGTYMPLARLDRRGIDEWAQFPLDNAQNIREWQHLLTGQSAVDSGTLSSKADQSPVHRHQDSGVKRKHQESGENRYQDTISEQDYLPMVSTGISLPHQRHEQPLLSPVTARPHLDQYWLSFEAATRKSQIENKADFSGPLDLPTEGQGPIESQAVEPVQISSNWEGAPSVNFQQQFLW